MKMPKSLLSSMLLLVGIAAVLCVAGCRKTSPRSHLRPSAPPPSAQQVLDTLTGYMHNLEEGKYAAAYGQLSRESQQLHTSAQFEQAAKLGMPLYDFKTAHVKSVDGATAIVNLHEFEDPSNYDFSLVREDGAWKVVYRGGIPAQPQAEHDSALPAEEMPDESDSDRGDPGPR